MDVGDGGFMEVRLARRSASKALAPPVDVMGKPGMPTPARLTAGVSFVSANSSMAKCKIKSFTGNKHL